MWKCILHCMYMCMKCLDFQDFCLEKNAHLIVILSISGTRRAEDVEVTAKREFGSRTKASQWGETEEGGATQEARASGDREEAGNGQDCCT